MVADFTQSKQSKRAQAQQSGERAPNTFDNPMSFVLPQAQGEEIA